MISYNRLLQKLNAKGITRTALGKELGISSRTIAKIGRGDKVSQRVLARIAGFLSCAPEELYQYISNNPLLQRLREEKDIHLPGGIYHELQIRMTYNSNHMEGSRLSHEQTRHIFETHTIDTQDDAIPIDDIIETVNHFRAIDYVIEHAEDALSEHIIKELHRILKQNTRDSTLAWFAVGDYKKRANTVGGHETSSPENVPAKIRSLLESYEEIGRAHV